MQGQQQQKTRTDPVSSSGQRHQTSVCIVPNPAWEPYGAYLGKKHYQHNQIYTSVNHTADTSIIPSRRRHLMYYGWNSEKIFASF
eukprot:38069-Pyramimonas_sp.AAC.1